MNPRMNRITVAFFALTFVQLVKSQTACSSATAAFNANATCVIAFASRTDVNSANILCMGTCRYLIENITNSCDSNVSYLGIS